MPGARSFTDLRFWQRARQWSKKIFNLTQKPPFVRDERLVRQINDSSESVMVNMAEGFGRGTQEEFITFLGYAIGSLDETQSHLCAAYDRSYFDKEMFGRLWRDGIEIRKLTVAFIRAMILPRGGVRTLGKPVSWSNKVWEIYERVTGQPRPEMYQQLESAAALPPRNDAPPS
ncbi:MAG TPA: four helix bundle protein [Pirellulales bacterium]|jgi:four helix bundle protein